LTRYGLGKISSSVDSAHEPPDVRGSRRDRQDNSAACSRPGTPRTTSSAALKLCFPAQIKPYLFDASGNVRGAPLDVSPLREVIQKHRDLLLARIMTVFRQGWPEGDIEVVADAMLASYLDDMADGLASVIRRLFNRLQWARKQLARLRDIADNRGALEADEEALRTRCERLVKKLRGEQRRRRAERKGIDDTNTYGVLAAKGFLPGYGLDTGAVTTTHEAPRYATDLSDWELKRGTVLALREGCNPSSAPATPRVAG